MKYNCLYCGAYIDIDKEKFCPNCNAIISPRKYCKNVSETNLYASKKELEADIKQCFQAYQTLLTAFDVL